MRSHPVNPVPAPSEQPEIPKLLALIDHKLSELGDVLNATEQKLAPVMGVENPETEACPMQYSNYTSTKFGTFLGTTCERIDALTAQVNSIYERTAL